MKKLLSFLIFIGITMQAVAAPALTIQNNQLALTFLGFFSAGILLAFTPCVLPMVPILASLLIGQKKVTTWRSIQIALAFILGSACAYAIAGMIAGYLGSTLQTMLQTPVVIIIFSLIFVLMALSMFGLFDLRLPTRLTNPIHQISNLITTKKLVNVAIIGMLSTLIASPCVTAPMLSALTFISQTGNALLGGLLLFVLALGMGIPLLLFAIGQSTFLPKAGPWMEEIKMLFGFMLLGIAIWMLARILSINIIMFLTGTLLIISMVSCGVLHVVAKDYLLRMKQGLYFVIFVYGILMLIGAASGHEDLLHPLQSRPNSIINTSTLSSTLPRPVPQLFSYAKNMAELDQALQQAKIQHQPVMIDFYAAWCPDCRALDRNVFEDVTIQQQMQAFKTIRIDITNDNDDLKALRSRYQVYGVPSIVFYDKQGNEVTSDRTHELSYEFLKQKLQTLS